MILLTYVQHNKAWMATVGFMVCAILIWCLKPACFFKRDGSLREFGVGYRERTILPIWLAFILLGIISYLAVLYGVHFQIAR